ncbi:MAG TPA: phosphate ABC transporter substrate-binding/OmpA family protein [Anaeromyxobacter sp.]|nr:phosphate ABC transporter substrate-binding/OmpA family protein [Anaeromyxobacter sp.]
MQALLEDLNSLPGVVGSMFCDGSATVLARAFHADFDDAALSAVASALAASGPPLKSLTGPIAVLDLRFRESRVVIRPAGDASLVVLCDKAANAQEVLAFASVACKKFERLRTPGLTGPATSPAVPVLGPGTKALGTAAAVPRPPSPRRHLPEVAVAAVAALALLGAAAYFVYPRLAGGPRRAPARAAAAAEARPTPAVPATARPGAGPQTRPAGPVQVRLRLSGADTLGADLVPKLAAAYLEAQKASGVEVRPGSELVSVEGEQGGEAVGVEFRPGSTGKGLEDLLSGSADVAVATRRVKPDERQKLAVLGVMNSPANEHVLGLGGIAVIVNKANSVTALDREQLAQILGGAATDWSTFGVQADEEWSAVGVNGKGGPVASGIHVYLPEDRSGIPEPVQAVVLGGKPWAKDAERLPTYQAVVDAVVSNPGGVGLVPMSAASGARVVPVSDLDDPPLVPTAFTVASEDYLLSHRLYLYTAQASQNAQVARFVAFALSPPGQALVRGAGFVELTVRAENRSPPAGSPAEYLRLTSGARRLTSTFRFEPGSAAFDSRAQQDLDRVVDYLRENDLNGGAVRVLGFADGVGKTVGNQQLSRDRALQVAQAFAQRGITGVTVAGMGSALPVADNSDEEGRRRNRRVEVWVAR